MRYLILFFLLLSSCGPKVSTKTPPRAKTAELQKVLITNSDLQGEYSQNTESLFALLWPLEFGAEAKSQLAKSLRTAKELQNTRKAYTSESTRLKKASQANQCECVLTGICETEIDPAQQEKSVKECTKVEAEQLKNDERLSTLVALQEELKTSVLEMGGFWLEVSTPAVYDFSTGKIDFKDAQFFNKDGERFSVVADNAFWRLDSVKIDGALQAQGELKIKVDDQVYRGELGFQLPERGN